MAFPFLPIVVSLLLSIASAIISAALMPRPKQPRPEAFKELESPTNSGGREIPVPFGTVTMKSPNVLGFWDKETKTVEVAL